MIFIARAEKLPKLLQKYFYFCRVRRHFLESFIGCDKFNGIPRR